MEGAKASVRQWKKICTHPKVLELEKAIKKRYKQMKKNDPNYGNHHVRGLRKCSNSTCANIESKPKEFKVCVRCKKTYYCSKRYQTPSV